MDDVAPVNFVLKGGPPWGFRIKQRGDRVIISKVNCGGRANKCGLKVNNEVVSVNKLEIDRHPLTLDRSAEDGENKAVTDQQLTKLDFTYHLIKHTINRQLQLSVRRHSDDDVIYQPLCYYIEDEFGNEPYPLAELYSQSEEEILSPSEEQEIHDSHTFAKRFSQQHNEQLFASQACASLIFDPPPGGDLTPSDLPAVITCSNSEESMPSAVAGPTYKAKAPKNIWSPGSTTTSSSKSPSRPKKQPSTTACATQTTPTKSETLPRGFRPVRINSLPVPTPSSGLPLAASARSLEPGPISPSTISEASIATSGAASGYRQYASGSLQRQAKLAREAQHQRNCVFNTLTSTTTNLYESDSSYIIKKKETSRKEIPEPVSRSTYLAVLRGDADIPMSGLQKPAPSPSAHKAEHEANVLVFDASSSENALKSLHNPQPQVDRNIDAWNRKMNDDLNCIYENLQEHQVKRNETKSRNVKLDSIRNDVKKDIEESHSSNNSRLFDNGRDTEVNIHYRAPVTRLLKEDILNEEELVKKQREQMRRYYEYEFERRAARDSQLKAQRRHLFTPTHVNVVHLERYQKAYAEKDITQVDKLKLARVLFDFHALSSSEISVEKGDIVIVQRAVNHNWVEVEDSQSGLKGLVPRNYLDFEQEGIARAKYDFDSKTPVEMSLKKGDVVKLLRKVDDNWYEGANAKNDTGIFPCTYVETIKQPLTLRLNNNTYSPLSTSPRPLSRGRSVSPQLYSRSLSPIRPHSTPHFNGSGQRSHHVIDPALNGLSSSGGGTSRKSSSKLYRVLFPYKPQQQDELELITGDMLTVTMHCDDGWFVGHSTLTGNYGTFPGNYVEALGSQSRET